LRGELSRWLIEPETGVFLGNPSARVRDELWQMAVKKSKGGSVVQLWSTRAPQGYKYRTLGNTGRELRDFEGIALVQMPPKKTRNTKPGQSELEPDAPDSLFDN
jgi:CRISPR-associated protein Cas2